VCVGHPILSPDAWFESPSSEQGQAALEVCAGCLVREACLSWALGLPDATALVASWAA
jgi:hypothetical protein